MMDHTNERGFTLLELLIVVAIIGIIAAIAIPNLLNAMDRGKQKRTMADLRSIATAIETYAVENSFYPTASSPVSLAGALEPSYINTLPFEDGWGRAYTVDSVPLDYTIWSGGSDGGALNFVGGPTNSITDSIVFSNGIFVQWPEGTQTN